MEEAKEEAKNEKDWQVGAGQPPAPKQTAPDGHRVNRFSNQPKANNQEDEEDESEQSGEHPREQGPKSLKEELQIEDLSRCIFFKDSKIFAAAGPGMPLLQVNTDGTFVSLDPDQPYRQEVDEDVRVEADEHGRLLDPLGQLRKLTGMKYQGKPLFFVARRHPENSQHLAAWFDEEWNAHYLYLGENILSAAMVLKIRDRMIDGELSKFEELSSD